MLRKSCFPSVWIEKKRKIIKVHTNPPSFPFHSKKVISDCEALRFFHCYVLWEVYWWIFSPSGQQKRNSLCRNCWFTCFSCERNRTERSLCALLMPFGCYCFSFITLQSKQLFWAFFILFWCDHVTIFSHAKAFNLVFICLFISFWYSIWIIDDRHKLSVVGKTGFGLMRKTVLCRADFEL